MLAKLSACSISIAAVKINKQNSSTLSIPAVQLRSADVAHLVNFRAQLIDCPLQFLVLLLEVVESQVDHVKYLHPVVLGFCLHRAVDGFTIIDVNVILWNYELLPTEVGVILGNTGGGFLPEVCP